MILVVEDDPEMRLLLERGLTSEGYTVRAVDNGVDALIAARTETIAGSVVDVMLPGMSKRVSTCALSGRTAAN